MTAATSDQNVTDKVPDAITPAEALKRLKDGNARYVADTPNERDFSSGRCARAKSQYPIAAILSCADSRLAPEFAFDQGPGDLFVMRVAGNVMSPNLLASLEYAVGDRSDGFLGVPLVVVLGHTNCGAVKTAIDVLKDEDANVDDLPGHLPGLISAIKPAVVIAEKAQTENLHDNAVAENVRQQVEQLRNSSPIVARLLAAKKINIVGGVYHLEKKGKLEMGEIEFIINMR